jgi:hypothetical protein
VITPIVDEEAVPNDDTPHGLPGEHKRAKSGVSTIMIMAGPMS